MSDLVYEVPSGENMYHACVTALAMANQHSRPVAFTFNRFPLRAVPGSNVRDVGKPYYDETGRREREREAQRLADKRRLRAFPKLLTACEEVIECHTMPADDDMNDSDGPWCTSCDSPVAECCCSMARCRAAIAEAKAEPQEGA